MAPPPPPPPICLPFFGSKPKRRLSGSSTSPVIYSGNKKSLSQTGVFESDTRGDLGVYHHAGQTFDTRSNPPSSQHPAIAPSGTGFTEFEANMGFGDLHSPKKDQKGKGKAVPVVGPDGVPMHVNAAGMSMEVNPPHGPMSPDARGAGGVAWAPTAENEMVDDDGSSYTSDTRTMTDSTWSGDESAGRPSSAYTTLTFRTDTEDYAAVPRDAVDRKGRIVRSNTMAGGMPKVKEKDGMTLKLGKGMKMTVATAGPALTTHGSVSRPLPAPMSRASTLPSVNGDGAVRKDSLMGTHVIPSPAPAPKTKRGFLGFGGKRKPVQLTGVGAGGGGLSLCFFDERCPI
ncbi:hypothetical protein CYLTODRAFT_106548 [Cylindrobasidium torrendii FP15055 ss-10]|uniref:Pal1-domain-containing protein n=1 Tax=Cylindrobasidium torrendii FP15055 ss-10 TaxID=1314674 RepID=A0A0D7B458_9AGAR|nr:hypothetical protein CYLTODRAFT_106548 [Cylindrobasidium torrendii FP15055 ss-10]